MRHHVVPSMQLWPPGRCPAVLVALSVAVSYQNSPLPALSNPRDMQQTVHARSPFLEDSIGCFTCSPRSSSPATKHSPMSYVDVGRSGRHCARGRAPSGMPNLNQKKLKWYMNLQPAPLLVIPAHLATAAATAAAHRKGPQKLISS